MSHHPETSKKYGCGGCDRPDEADNLIQCVACDAWWHFSCAGVTGSITDRSWMCTRCKRTSRASSRASVASRSSSQLAESMARLRERQELQKQRTEVEMEKKFLEEQRKLLEASIAAEEERRSQVSCTNSRRRVQDWIENSADQTTSAAEGNRQPVVQQHETHPHQGNSDYAAAAGNLDIQLHSSPLRDRTIPAFETTEDFSDLQPLPEVINQHNARDLIRELRVRLERCLLQSEPTSPQLADLQQQLQLCREEIEGMHFTVHRLATASTPAAQTDNMGTAVSSNDRLVQPAESLGAIPKHRPNEFLQGKCHASENQTERIHENNLSQLKSYPTMQNPPHEQQRITHARSNAMNNEQSTVTQHTPFPPAITQVPHLQQYAFGYQPPVQQELVLPPLVQQPTVQQSAMQQPPVQQHAESQHPVQQPPVQEPLLQSRTGQQSAMQEPPVQQYIEQQPPVQQPPLVQQLAVQQSKMQQPLVQQIDRQSQVQQYAAQQLPVQQPSERQPVMQQPSMQQLIECQRPVQQREPLVQPRIVQQSQVQQYPAQPFPVQQPSERQSTMQQPSVQQHIECPRPVQQPLVQPRIVQQPQVRQYQVPQYSEQQPSVQQSAMQQPSVQEHVERHHPVPQPSVQRGQIQQPMQLAQPPSMQQPLMQPSSLQQQSERWPSVQARPVQQHPVQQYAEQPNLLPQFPMWASPVQQLSTQQPLRQQHPVGTPPISSEGAAPDVNGQERRVDELPTPQQLTSRQSLARDLPTFSGDPAEWPIFISNFEYTTRTCGYTNGENMVRLERCLRGHALESVRSRLVFPAAVPQVIETLRMRYGRPELLINVLLQKVKAMPSIRGTSWKPSLSSGWRFKNCVTTSMRRMKERICRTPLFCRNSLESCPQIRS
ncbi:putative mediator of RNA polymerase II transcription subunit 12 [Aedes albopictus]|uniref:PHD-type domain-containing protein n=1 Tax=Aedes albopictus TaxID=7160 RepID=A0ABM1Y2Z8_AEDAL